MRLEFRGTALGALRFESCICKRAIRLVVARKRAPKNWSVLFVPSEGLRANFTIGPASFPRCFGVINQPVFEPVRRCHEAAMANTASVKILLKDGSNFSPRRRIQQITTVMNEETQTIVLGPRSTC